MVQKSILIVSQTERRGRRKKGRSLEDESGGEKHKREREKKVKRLKILLGAIVPGEYSRQAKALCIPKWHSAC